jgi:hypothetical protein
MIGPLHAAMGCAADPHMKAMKLPKQLQPFLEVAERADAETLVFTEKKRPVAALVSIRNVDRETLALSTNPQFMRIIEASRREMQAEKTTSLGAIQRKFRVAEREGDAVPLRTIPLTSFPRKPVERREPWPSFS